MVEFNGCIASLTKEGATALKSIVVGRYIQVGSDKTGTVKRLVDDIIEVSNKVVVQTDKIDTLQTVDEATVTMLTMFTDETAPSGGSVYSKYITKPISLNNTCDYLRIMFAGCMPKGSSIELFYKTYLASGSQQYEDVNWIPYKPTIPLKAVEVGSEVFQDVKYDIPDIPSFDTVAVKIVFRSDDSCAVPMIRDLRVIACI